MEEPTNTKIFNMGNLNIKEKLTYPCRVKNFHS